MNALDILQLLQGGDAGISIGDPGANPYAQQQMPEPPVQSSSNIADQIQYMVGSKKPQEPNMAQNILSQRFEDNQPASADLSSVLEGLNGTSYGDYAQGITQSALGKPTLGTSIGQSRTGQALNTIVSLEKLQNAGTGNSVFGQAMAQINADPEMSKLPLATKISIAKSGVGQGMTLDNAGSLVPISGAPAAKGQVKFAEGRGSAAGKVSIDNNKSALELQNLDSSIEQARTLLPKVSLTGPILGRAGAAANEPDYANLQGALNSIVLQAKDLYNLGSGQGFSDADRDFLQDVVAGKYSRSETIGLALQRMSDVSKKRQQFLNQQSQGLRQEFNYGNSGGGSTSNADPLGIR